MIKALKHGVSLLKTFVRDIHAKKKRSPKWRTLQKEYLKNHNICAACGSKARLQVHHKLPFDDYPELELDPHNLITLCMSEKECHIRIGHGGSYTKYTYKIDQYIDQIHKKQRTFEEIWKIAKEERLDKRAEVSKSLGA